MQGWLGLPRRPWRNSRVCGHKQVPFNRRSLIFEYEGLDIETQDIVSHGQHDRITLARFVY